MPYLIISRKLEQSFRLVKEFELGADEPELIEITVAGRHGTDVRIGINAPLCYKIIRTEDIENGTQSEKR